MPTRIISLLREKIKAYPSLKSFLKSPVNWIRCAFLTLKYVDEWTAFPAFQVNGSITFRLRKGANSKLIIRDRLILEQWMEGNEAASLKMGSGSTCIIEKQFTIGNGVRIFVDNNATLNIKGVMFETDSGITANSVVMVNKYLEIGYDCIIAWDTFITDCDWHGIDGKKSWANTIIGDHVWIGVGSKILKGANVNSNSIVTSLSVVLAGLYPERSLISGAPAKVIKSGIPLWSREMSC